MPRYSYSVITQHGEDRKVRWSRKIEGDDYDATLVAAMTHAEAMSPDVDGSTCPNVDDEIVARKDYERGMFWGENRYAVIIDNRPLID